jgi:hypothetical protein
VDASQEMARPQLRRSSQLRSVDDVGAQSRRQPPDSRRPL